MRRPVLTGKHPSRLDLGHIVWRPSYGLPGVHAKYAIFSCIFKPTSDFSNTSSIESIHLNACLRNRRASSSSPSVPSTPAKAFRVRGFSRWQRPHRWQLWIRSINSSLNDPKYPIDLPCRPGHLRVATGTLGLSNRRELLGRKMSPATYGAAGNVEDQWVHCRMQRKREEAYLISQICVLDDYVLWNMLLGFIKVQTTAYHASCPPPVVAHHCAPMCLRSGGWYFESASTIYMI